MQRYYKTVLDNNGNPAAAVSCTVYDASTGNLSTLFNDYDNSLDAYNGRSNPVVSGADGVIAFAARNGRYNLIFSGGNRAASTESWVTLLDGSGGWIATGTLAQFDPTTSAQLAGVITDETGTGPLVFSDTPTLTTPILNDATLNDPIITGTASYTATGTTPAILGTYSTGSRCWLVKVDSGISGRGPNVIDCLDMDFTGVKDPVMCWGYNATAGGALVLGGEQALTNAIEGNYNDGSGQNKMEYYVQYISTAGATVRPHFIQMNRTTNKISAHFLKGDKIKIMADDAGAEIGSYMYDFEINRFTMYAPQAGNTTRLTVKAVASYSAFLSLGYDATDDVIQIYNASLYEGRWSQNGQYVMSVFSNPGGGSAGGAISVGGQDNTAVGVFMVGTSSNTVKGVIIRGRAGQVGNLFEAQDSASALLASITPTGAITSANKLNLAAIAATTVEGDFYNETGQAKHGVFSNGIAGWVDKCIFSGYAEVTQSGVVTDQSLFTATCKGTRTLPANWWKPGKALRYRLAGIYTTDAAAGTATITIKLGSTTFRTTGSFNLDALVTAGYWQLEGAITCLTDGAPGTIAGQITWIHSENSGGGSLPLHSQPMTTTAAVNYTTTASGAFDVLWTADDAGTSITCSTQRLWEIC